MKLWPFQNDSFINLILMIFIARVIKLAFLLQTSNSQALLKDDYKNENALFYIKNEKNGKGKQQNKQNLF